MDRQLSNGTPTDEYSWAVQPWNGEPITSDDKGEYFTRDGVEYFRPWDFNIWWTYRRGVPSEGGNPQNSGYQGLPSSQMQPRHQQQQHYQQKQGDHRSTSSKLPKDFEGSENIATRSVHNQPLDPPNVMRYPPPPPRPSHVREKRVLKNLSDRARRKQYKLIAKAEREGRQPPSPRPCTWKDHASKAEIEYYEYENSFQRHVSKAARTNPGQPNGKPQESSRGTHYYPEHSMFQVSLQHEDEELEEDDDDNNDNEEEEEEEEEDEEDETEKHSRALSPQQPRIRELKTLKSLREAARIKHKRSIEQAKRYGHRPPSPRTFSWKDYATKEELEHYVKPTKEELKRLARAEAAERNADNFMDVKFPTPPPHTPFDKNQEEERKANVAWSLGLSTPFGPGEPSWRYAANEDDREYYDYEEDFR